MSNHTFLAAVRFKDGSKLKFRVEDVPDDLDTVRGIITHELTQHPVPVQAILLRTDSQPFTRIQGDPHAQGTTESPHPSSAA